MHLQYQTLHLVAFSACCAIFFASSDCCLFTEISPWLCSWSFLIVLWLLATSPAIWLTRAAVLVSLSCMIPTQDICRAPAKENSHVTVDCGCLAVFVALQMHSYAQILFLRLLVTTMLFLHSSFPVLDVKNNSLHWIISAYTLEAHGTSII